MSVKLPLPPVIETARLRLRPHRVSDFEDVAAMWSDPWVIRYTIGTASPRQGSWQRMLAYRGHWALLGFGFWAVEEKSSGAYIGELGFADFKRSVQPSIDGMPELGWALVSHAGGKGYATEGLRGAIAWGDSHFGSIPTVCIIHSENLLSFRVAEKLGYSESFRFTSGGITRVILSRTPGIRRRGS